MTLLEILNLAPKDAVLEFISLYGGEKVRVPILAAWLKKERNEAIIRQRKGGMTYEQLSKRHGLKERQIRRILEHAKAA